MTNTINLAALGFGGIDTSSLVSSLVALEQQPLTNMQNRQQNVQSASATISSFAGTLSALGNAAAALADPTTFQSMKATSSDASIVATTSGSPPAGQWSVSVSTIAKQQRTLSTGTTDTSSALGLSGQLGITLGNGTTAQINVASTDSLQDVANAISSSGLRVQASIMYDGSKYHLLVSGLDTGTSNAIAFDESKLTSTGFTLGLSTPANTLQQATNANLTVGGVSVTSATNQVTNAIPGVTLALTQPTTQPATLTIGGDSSGLEQQIQSFVTAYNAVVTGGHTASGYGTAKASNTLLQGDEAVRSSLHQLGQVVAQQVGGSTGAYTSLASVGITLNDDGTLSFAQSTFSSAISADPASVERLFVTNPANGSTGVMGQLGAAIVSLTDPHNGAIQAELDAFSSQNKTMTTEEASLQLQVTTYQTQLQNEFTQMNTQLAGYKQMSQQLNAMTGTTSSTNGSTNTVL